MYSRGQTLPSVGNAFLLGRDAVQGCHRNRLNGVLEVVGCALSSGMAEIDRADVYWRSIHEIK